jgi:hypothetical protein
MSPVATRTDSVAMSNQRKETRFLQYQEYFGVTSIDTEIERTGLSPIEKNVRTNETAFIFVCL